MADKKIPANRRWALKKKRQGLCTRCGRKRNRFSWYCDYCQSKATLYMRRFREAQKKAAEAKARVLGR